MEMKQAYEEKADAQLREWQAWIEQYRTDPVTYGAVTYTEQQHMMDRLENCYQNARVRLDELHSSRDHSWEFAKQAVERAMIELKHALDESGAAHAARLVQLETGRSHVYAPFQKRG